MKKIIFRKLILDVTKFFLLTSISLSLIILVVQAVNFLDYISEDGHGFYTYFGITTLNFPKIFTRIMPFCIFITIFYVIHNYELKNELGHDDDEYKSHTKIIRYASTRIIQWLCLNPNPHLENLENLENTTKY